MWKLIPSFVYSWGKVAGEPRPKSQKNKIMTAFVITLFVGGLVVGIAFDPFKNIG